LRANSGIAVGFACQADSPVMANYPPNAVSGTGATASVVLATNVLGPVVLSTVSKSGVELQRGTPASSPVKAKAARRCQNAIGKVRSKIVTHVVKSATACQKKIDRHSTTFGAVAPSCLEKAGGRFGDRVSKLRKACRGIAGVDVGSCAELPGCVRDSAVAT